MCNTGLLLLVLNKKKFMLRVSSASQQLLQRADRTTRHPPCAQPHLPSLSQRATALHPIGAREAPLPQSHSCQHWRVARGTARSSVEQSTPQVATLEQPLRYMRLRSWRLEYLAATPRNVALRRPLLCPRLRAASRPHQTQNPTAQPVLQRASPLAIPGAQCRSCLHLQRLSPLQRLQRRVPGCLTEQ